MAVGKSTGSTFAPRVVAAAGPRETERSRAISKLAAFLQETDRPPALQEKLRLAKASFACNSSAESALAEIDGHGRDGLSRDDRASRSLASYISEVATQLKGPVSKSVSARLISIYSRFLEEATGMMSADYADRPYQENLELFGRIEPLLTACCRRCGMPSAEDNVDGVVRAALAAAEREGARNTPARPDGADIIPISGRGAKQLKEEADIKMSMDEAGTAGMFPDLRKEPGFDSATADFQDKVEFFESAARLTWKPSTPEMAADHKAEMERFRQMKDSLLTPQVLDYLRLLGDDSQKWTIGSDISRRHNIHCAFLFLFSSVEKCYSNAEAKKVIGLYALLGSLRKWVADTVSAPDFFDRDIRDLTSDYMDVAEPQLVAFERLCGGIGLASFVDGVSGEHNNAFAFYSAVNETVPEAKK
jgi:hypothetical protein